MSYYISDTCVGCQKCRIECPMYAIYLGENGPAVSEENCIGCGTCARVCNVGAPVNREEEQKSVPRHDLIEKSCDLVVLGGGGAGMVAAARAAWLTGCKVIVLEKSVKTGGGAWFAADFKVFGSKWQQERGIPDVTESCLRQAMDDTYWQLDPRLVRNCFEATGHFFDWLCETGTGVESLFGEGKYIFDGPKGPVIPVFKKRRRGKQGGAGKFVMDQMLSVCKACGVEVLTETAAQEIEMDHGRIEAVIARDRGGPIRIQCRSCVLATGSWINNQSVLEKVAPVFARIQTERSPHRNPAYTGDGIRLAESAGAFVDYDSFCLRLMGPEMMMADNTPFAALWAMNHQPSSILVNQNGQRWIDEGATASNRMGFFKAGQALLHQPGGVAYRIFDTNCVKTAVSRYKAGVRIQAKEGAVSFPEDWEYDLDAAVKEYAPWMKKADTPEALAAELGIPAKAFAETIARYNESCALGRDRDFFKRGADLVPLNEGPYYGQICRMATDGAFGGVQVDPEMRVLRADGTAIDGFFAGGDFTSSRFVNRGGEKVQIINDLAWAFASGFLAGESAAKFLSEQA